MSGQKGNCPLDQFVLNGTSEEMADQMANESYVLDRIAILGQSTVIYAPPNTGKTLLTLRLLIDSITAEKISPNDVYYVNADDDFRGLQGKLQIAEVWGFKMLAPAHMEFKSSDLLDIISKMSNQDTARGKILILDTLKKFCDPMDKNASREFGTVIREFISRGGSVISLAHCNKNPDSEGKPIYGGVSDTLDDVDCGYLLYETASDGARRTVIFENIKMRGDVDKEISYSYSTTEKDYTRLINSIEPVDEVAAAKAKQKLAVKERLQINELAIESITECIEDGIVHKTSIIADASKKSGSSKAKIAKILKEHSGTDYPKGHRWVEVKGDKNAKCYRLTRPYTSDDYLMASGG
jgi:hypothetical protein